ncbi:hypothetical protein BS50DRAFT_85031 [Corynespora cassiicola Philippines]|uniref:Uncharacterized protein n=1 Tax=Corynespora cassiicola Philippines TaxID=1448308 RepID=A0A2T2NDU1_CORCC|nr:hypothetical protein BS50DRAFT_85031 [Corynespora cassiicola Philippines]
MATLLEKPLPVRSGSSIHSHEEEEFAHQHEEQPLEISSTSSVQGASNTETTREHNPWDNIDTEHDTDEPPPPYAELADPLADAPEIAPIEYSCDNSPTLVEPAGLTGPIEPPPRNPARLHGSDAPEVSPIQPPGSPASTIDPTLVPAPLQILHVRTQPSNRSLSQVSSPQSQAPSTFSSAKAREAGFEIEPTSPRRTNSQNSLPSIQLLPSSEPLRHTREPGKLKAYLIPFPKPRMKGLRAEDIPTRFLVYTPPPPPLSKPAPGEKESHWHKTQRTWQEDVRRATVTQASKASWEGMKATTTRLIGKGVNMTRSTNVEFLDRVSGGALSASEHASSPSPSDTPRPETPSSPHCPARSISSTSMDKDTKPKRIEELTLIYPPSLALAPETIRSEFIDTLVRTRDKSRKQAVVASSLLPFAATVDAALIFTFGGLTGVSGVWATTSIRGAKTSKKLSDGIALADEQQQQQFHETETRGCTCGNHEHEFGAAETVVRDKGKGRAVALQMQQSTQLEVLTRYLELACLRREFSLFPQIQEQAEDVGEVAVLEAIGWEPVAREGRDLEVDFKGRIEMLSPEQDRQFQTKDVRDDVKRVMRKGADEWVAWCKAFQKNPEAALRK